MKGIAFDYWLCEKALSFTQLNGWFCIPVLYIFLSIPSRDSHRQQQPEAGTAIYRPKPTFYLITTQLITKQQFGLFNISIPCRSAEFIKAKTTSTLPRNSNSLTWNTNSKGRNYNSLTWNTNITTRNSLSGTRKTSSKVL
jgi:hypothetical protein